MQWLQKHQAQDRFPVNVVQKLHAAETTSRDMCFALAVPMPPQGPSLMIVLETLVCCMMQDASAHLATLLTLSPCTAPVRVKDYSLRLLKHGRAWLIFSHAAHIHVAC